MKQSTSFAHWASKCASICTFNKNRYYLFLINLLLTLGAANAWGAYEKASSIAVGDVVVLVYETDKKELEGISTTSTKYGIGVSYTTTPAGAYELTVEAGSISGTYSFKCPNGQYLYWSTGNSLATNATKNANTSWTVTFSSGNAVIKNAKDATRQLQWNASSPRFACYTTSQKAVQLYKEAATCTEILPKLTYSPSTLDIGNTATPTLIGNTGSGTVTYLSSNDAVATVNSSTGVVTAVAAGSATITASIAAKGSYCDGSATATITVKQSAEIILSEAGAIQSITGKYVGESYKLPFSTDVECGDKTFVGWSTVTIDNSANKPTSNFYAPGASVTLEKDNTFYAVFAESDGGLSDANEVLLNYEGGTSSNLNATEGLSVSGNGTDYSASNHDPYLVKLDDTGDYILYSNESKPYISQVFFKVKMIGGASNSKITIKTSDDGKNYTAQSECTISGSQNNVKTFTVNINTYAKYVQLYFTKGSNIGFGPLIIYTKSSSYQNYTTSCTTPSEYTVTFNANGHGTAPTPQTVASGQKATAPTPVPTATGYTFGGWYEESECENEFDFNTAITADITLYAKWTPITYTVSFDNNGGTGTMATQTFTYNQAQTLTANTFTRTGYTFSGWNTKSDGLGDRYTNSQSVKNLASTNGATITLYAQWEINTYKVTFNANGGTGSMSTQTFTHGQEQALNANTFTRAHYTFNGWKDGNDNTYTDKQSITLTADLTLYAQWTAKTYTITLDANGGTFVDNRDSQTKGSATFDYIYGTYATYNDAPNLTDYYTDLKRTGYQFDKWVSAGSPWNKFFTNTGDRTIQAQWSKLYSITLSENGTTKELDAQTSTSYTLPTELSAGSCQDDTKELVGWSTVAIPNPGDKPTSNFYELGETVTLTADQTTFYAVFATVGEGGVDNTDYSIVHTSNVTLTNEGGTSATISKVKISEVDYTAIKAGTGSAQGIVRITVPAGTTKLSFHMAGWNKEGGKTISLTGATATPSSFTTVADAGVSGNSTTYTLSGTIADYFYSTTLSNIDEETTLIFSNGGANQRFVIWGVNASTGGAASYSDYTTTCVKLPDPVLSFATEPANPIEFTDAVCGGNSSKQSVTVVGENLRDVVNVSITGPYKIARTASTALKDFTTSLTLDKTASGTIHSNYQTVYIISTPPAQSTEPTTGTLTFTTTKGNTLTVNLSTPTVTCTQYTLSLVDRGVSTEQPTKYYAGEMINEAPADPEGVCTDPIHYVFDGWAEATVAAGATTYTKVTFPYTVSGNTKFYAVYRYLEGGGNGDYNLVTSALDDWSGDYLIAYSDQIFANGTIGGESGIGAKNNKVDLSSNISNNTIPATVGDQYNVTLEAVTGGYVLKTQDGKYNYHTNNTGNGISASTIGYADDYPITVKFVSEEEINLCLGGSAIGSVFRYNAQGFFRFYKNGGQNPVYLYKKADGTTYYTTSPVCGPHLAITDGKDIYVTGGNAGGTRDLVIAQQKVSYKATRLNVGPTSQVPDVKVATNGITVGGVVTSDVKVAIDQNKEQQTDGTYTITGTITVQYQPSANNKQEDIQVQLAVDYNSDAKDAFIVHARSLPQEFVIVAKQGDKWYALNGDMSNGSSANPANGQVTLDNDANPTKATYTPCNTIYTLDGVPNTGDRTRVRFQGTDGAWLWAASGTNVGIQNKSLKEIPEGNNNAYNWKLETDDNITYKFHNDNNSRLLGLNGEKFGMYASGVQDIRILPYEAKCLYNYAPSNLKVSVLKGTYVTLTWDAVAGATKYQYSTNGTTWTDAGTEPTVTINNLTVATEYIYYIRAYHEDAGVSQECIDYAEITFTTANCDDVPTDITYTADLNSITVSWTAAAPTATITYNTKEDGTGGGGTINNATSPCRISGGLDKNTTYYIQIFAGGTCASPIVPVKTEDVEVDIVEWQPQGIIVDINTDETIGVTLENEVSYGSGLGTEATELFFSKYYEASYNVKLVAIYNGTKNIIDLTDYTIQYGKTSWETNYITLKDFGATKGQIQPGEEIILYSMQDGTQDDEIMDCVHEDFPDGNWVEVTSSNNEGKGILSFAGDKTIVLKKADNIIDVIGAIAANGLPTNSAVTSPSWGDAKGWTCETGLSIADDTQIGISTNRCLLIRNNTVTSGENAVTQNIADFVTLCTEWKGAQVPDSDIDNGVAASCENFAYVGTFDYSDYYTKYVPMGDEQVFDENARNADGTVTIPITDLYKHACSNIRVKLSNKDGEVLSDREYKVPIMITTTQGTDGEAFIALQQNLATKEVDAEGNVINTYPLSLDEVREICKTCDVVIRDNATLMKMADDAANDHPEVHDIYVYENSSLIVPNGTNYTINNLSLRRKQDAVASVSAYPDALKLPESAAAPISLDFRLSAESWHWFTLPFDCNISEVTWIDGSTAQYNVDWFLMTYDGEKRAETQAGGCWKAYTGTTINAGDGFIIAINGNINNPAHTYELRFPMSKEVLAAEGTDKTVAVRAWGVETNIRPNHKGWNLVGNPYLAYYQRNNITNFEGLRLGQLTGPDPQTGYWEQTGDVPYVVVPVGAGWIAYEQVLASETDLLPFTAYFVQVGNDGKHESSDDLSISFDHTKLQLSATPMPASIIQRATSETDVIEPVIVGVSLTNSLGESDKTSLVIDNQFTDEYEMNADFFKWFGDYYKYYTKPVVYSLGADNGKRAFNALSEDLVTQPISLGMYAAQAGNYTFTLDRRSDLSKVQEVWLYDATQDKYINLMQDSYTFQTAKTESAGRFFLSVKMAPKVSTDINNVTDGTIWATTQDHTIFVNGLLSNAQLWIYDATGKLLHTDQTQYYQHTYQVPVSGTYFVRVQNTMQTQTIKVVVE